MQQHKIYERARLARDARFDGQFYIGVVTTGIYCRPICPANPPKSENVKFYPSAAAAGEAGFRPCLRCRPECAPGSPAWSGTSTTVRRGLRLIANGALDDGSVEHLAERLGVSSRHLRRLFTRHIGASPLAVAQTQRLHFSKRLIDETTLPLNHIAVAAGFRSTRRFNDTFKSTYGRSPRELRKTGQHDDASPAATLVVRLPYRKPFAWNTLLEFFRNRVTPGVEAVDGDCYRRTLCVVKTQAVVELRPSARGNYLSLTLHSVNTPALLATVHKARDTFDLDAPVAQIASVLSTDPLLKKILRVHPGIRVPGDWTAQYVAMRALKNPDALPASDLGLLKALHYPRRISPLELTRHAERWRPWRAYAALLLWNSIPGSGA